MNCDCFGHSKCITKESRDIKTFVEFILGRSITPEELDLIKDEVFYELVRYVIDDYLRDPDLVNDEN